MITAIQKLETMTAQRFHKEAERYGISDEEIGGIVRQVQQCKGSQEANLILFPWIQKLAGRLKIKNYSEFDGFVREFQALVNHHVIYDTSGEARPSSPFLEIIGTDWRDRYPCAKAFDRERFAQFTLEAHEKIDTFMNGRGEQSGVITAIGRHVLDWYLQLFPKEAFSKSPGYAAAIALHCLKRYNEIEIGYALTPFILKDLSKLAGFNGAPSSIGAATSVVYDYIIDAIGDPDLWLIDPSLVSKEPVTAEDVPEDILKKRKEIEDEITELLQTHKSDFTLEDVKTGIYHERSTEDFQRLISMFDDGIAGVELGDILEVINDAWNFFPHKFLHGRCPEEMLREHSN